MNTANMIVLVWVTFVMLMFGKCNTKRKQKLDPMEAALNTLQDLILSQDPPKGEAFKTIPGPSKNEKVIHNHKIKCRWTTLEKS